MFWHCVHWRITPPGVTIAPPDNGGKTSPHSVEADRVLLKRSKPCFRYECHRRLFFLRLSSSLLLFFVWLLLIKWGASSLNFLCPGQSIQTATKEKMGGSTAQCETFFVASLCSRNSHQVYQPRLGKQYIHRRRRKKTAEKEPNNCGVTQSSVVTIFYRSGTSNGFNNEINYTSLHVRDINHVDNPTSQPPCWQFTTF